MDKTLPADLAGINSRLSILRVVCFKVKVLILKVAILWNTRSQEAEAH